jgi:energy-coupling factor transporter transmembrane protein EcfT
MWNHTYWVSVAAVMVPVVTVVAVIPVYFLRQIPEAFIALIGFGILVALTLALGTIYGIKFYYLCSWNSCGHTIFGKKIKVESKGKKSREPDVGWRAEAAEVEPDNLDEL